MEEVEFLFQVASDIKDLEKNIGEEISLDLNVFGKLLEEKFNPQQTFLKSVYFLEEKDFYNSSIYDKKWFSDLFPEDLPISDDINVNFDESEEIDGKYQVVIVESKPSDTKSTKNNIEVTISKDLHEIFKQHKEEPIFSRDMLGNNLLVSKIDYVYHTDILLYKYVMNSETLNSILCNRVMQIMTNIYDDLDNVHYEPTLEDIGEVFANFFDQISNLSSSTPNEMHKTDNYVIENQELSLNTLPKDQNHVSEDKKMSNEMHKADNYVMENQELSLNTLPKDQNHVSEDKKMSNEMYKADNYVMDNSELLNALPKSYILK